MPVRQCGFAVVNVRDDGKIPARCDGWKHEQRELCGLADLMRGGGYSSMWNWVAAARAAVVVRNVRHGARTGAVLLRASVVRLQPCARVNDDIASDMRERVRMRPSSSLRR